MFEGTLKAAPEKLGISGYTLKLIAVVTMFIDHLAASVLLSMIRYSDRIPRAQLQTYRNLYWFMRGAGRMAFPIYLFLLVEGFRYTRSKWKYARNMLIFAFLSEFPFDLALFNKYVDMKHQNVYWQLLLGILMLWAISKVETFHPEKQGELWMTVRLLASAAIAFGFAALAENVLRCDYGSAGIVAVFLMYELRRNRLLSFTAGVIGLGMMSSQLEFWALLMLIPIYLYNGTRGKATKGTKYFFYVFYPLHLGLLGLIQYLFIVQPK